MKKFIIASIIACPMPSYAVDDGVDYCEIIGSIAKNIMSVRQKGVSAMQLYEEMGGYSEVSEITRDIIKEAYSYSIYMGDEFQQRVVSDFSSEWFMACLEANER